MYKVRTYNNIAKIGLDQFTDQYEVGPVSDNPDAILLRSHKLQIEEINSNVEQVLIMYQLIIVLQILLWFLTLQAQMLML